MQLSADPVLNDHLTTFIQNLRAAGFADNEIGGVLIGSGATTLMMIDAELAATILEQMLTDIRRMIEAAVTTAPTVETVQ